jgi:hypothetical protein
MDMGITEKENLKASYRVKVVNYTLRGNQENLLA